MMGIDPAGIVRPGHTNKGRSKMNIEIDQDKLCDFCKSINDSKMSMCEGSDCERMRELYLEDVGVTDTDGVKKTFEMLCPNDTISRLCISNAIPYVEIIRVNGVKKMNDNPLTINIGSDSMSIKESNVSSYRNTFIYKKDADIELEKECTKRIIALSKVIGSINK